MIHQNTFLNTNLSQLNRENAKWQNSLPKYSLPNSMVNKIEFYKNFASYSHYKDLDATKGMFCVWTNFLV